MKLEHTGELQLSYRTMRALRTHRYAWRLRRAWTTATYGARNPGRRVLGLALCGIVAGLAESLLVVLIVALVVESGTEAPLIGEPPDTWLLAGLTLGLVAVVASAHSGAAWISSCSSRDVQQTVQGWLMTAFLEAPWAVQSSARAGELQELVTVRAHIVATGTQEAAQAISTVLSIAVLVAAATAVSPAATGGLVLAAGALIGLSFGLRHRRRAAVSRAASGQASVAVEVTETAQLGRELRIFGVHRQAGASVQRRIDWASRRLADVRLEATLSPQLTRDASVALLVVVLATLVERGSVSRGALAATAVLVLRALGQAQSLATVTARWPDREDGVRRIRDRLAAWESPAARGSRPCPGVNRISLRGVSFTYPDSCQPALRDVDLDLRAGELVGVIGRTGSGKSTLAGVLLGALAASHGDVLVDGVEIRELDPAAWHARTAWVDQEPRLLTGTVSENIRFLREGLGDAELVGAVEQAGLAGELDLDRHVGPAGAALSGGQRQRIAIARALAGNPDVVVFDEPTSGLDVHTEEVVRLTLDRLREARIVVVIAHRLSTVRTCDRLVVMDGGRATLVEGPAARVREDERWLHAALGS